MVKSSMLSNGGMSNPDTALVRSSTCSRWQRNSSNSFAAVLFWLNDQMPQKYGLYATNRPFGPRGAENVQQSCATRGWSRFATAQAEGGLKINALWPEIKARLLDALS